VGRFYIQLASEPDRWRVLTSVRSLLKPPQLLFVGVTDPINPRVESPEEVRDRVLEAAELIPIESLGTIDDCGFSPFADDTSTSRATAFAKVKSRVEGLPWAWAARAAKMATLTIISAGLPGLEATANRMGQGSLMRANGMRASLE
jgi:5-methyltetrahydropteroyltriglutamate--homocysteine methyltransferase